jgi:hypothetical protein
MLRNGTRREADWIVTPQQKNLGENVATSLRPTASVWTSAGEALIKERSPRIHAVHP